eukprot:335102-Chlamydomonas_euryale.AAC.1
MSSWLRVRGTCEGGARAWAACLDVSTSNHYVTPPPPPTQHTNEPDVHGGRLTKRMILPNPTRPHLHTLLSPVLRLGQSAHGASLNPDHISAPTPPHPPLTWTRLGTRCAWRAPAQSAPSTSRTVP